jgi:hypothetical protein
MSDQLATSALQQYKCTETCHGHGKTQYSGYKEIYVTFDVPLRIWLPTADFIYLSLITLMVLFL